MAILNSAAERVHTGPQLVRAVEALLPHELRDAEVIASADEDGDLTLTLIGVRLGAMDYLEPAEREYEVKGTITVPVSFTVRSSTEDEAHDRATVVLTEVACELSSSYIGNVFAHDDDVDNVDVQGYSSEEFVDSIREA